MGGGRPNLSGSLRQLVCPDTKIRLDTRIPRFARIQWFASWVPVGYEPGTAGNYTLEPHLAPNLAPNLAIDLVPDLVITYLGQAGD